jgi:hypothetical protein
MSGFARNESCIFSIFYKKTFKVYIIKQLILKNEITISEFVGCCLFLSIRQLKTLIGGKLAIVLVVIL